MAGPSSTSSAAEWLDAAPGVGFDGSRAASGGSGGKCEEKSHNDGADLATYICRVAGGLKGQFSGIGAVPSHCDCGEVIRKSGIKTLVHVWGDYEDAWMNCLCQECGERCEVCGFGLGCIRQVRKSRLHVGGICKGCRQCDLTSQNAQKSRDRLLAERKKNTCCKQQRAKQVSRNDRILGDVSEPVRYQF